MKTEQIIIEVPTKTLHVEHAKCPNGHSLMDPDVPINNYPSIKVVLQYGDIKGNVHLDPATFEKGFARNVCCWQSLTNLEPFCQL